MIDLLGGGIRALAFDPVLNRFLIVNEVDGYDDSRHSQIWSWTGTPDAAPEPLTLPEILALNNPDHQPDHLAGPAAPAGHDRRGQ